MTVFHQAETAIHWRAREVDALDSEHGSHRSASSTYRYWFDALDVRTAVSKRYAMDIATILESAAAYCSCTLAASLMNFRVTTRTEPPSQLNC